MPASGRGAFLPPPKSAPSIKNASITFPANTKVSQAPKAKALQIPRLGQSLREGAIEARQFPHGAAGKPSKTLGFQPKPPKPSGGASLSLGTIVTNPGAIVAQGYKNLAHMTGVSALKDIGKIPAEGLNLPTQVLPAAFYTGKALAGASKGHPEELQQLGKQFLNESAVAHVLKGEFGKAIEKAGEHPLGTALEASGVAAGVDRALGALGRASGADVAKLAQDGATTVSRAPRELVPGGATEPLRPYDKGLVRKMAQQKTDQKPIQGYKLNSAMKRHYDRTEASLLRITRSTRNDVTKARRDAIKGVSGASQDAVVPHGQWLADPSVLDKHGVPVYRQHLKEMVAHLSTPPEHELPQDVQVRLANRDRFQHLLEDSTHAKNPAKAYQAALRTAADKRALEPQLVKHGVYTPEQMRVAKAIPAFQFHFRDEHPFVETTAGAGESPFRLGERTVPVNEVYQKLEAKGIHEKQLSFTSTRPFENPNAAYRSGHTPGGARVAKGQLTGANFMRGVTDHSYEAAVRQHLTDAQILDRANGDWWKANNYVHDKQAIAKLVEAKIKDHPEQAQTLQDYVKELREGGKFFEQRGGQSELARALHAREVLGGLYPDMHLEPVRTVHPYATAKYTAALNKRLMDTHLDQLDPAKFHEDQQFWQSQMFTPHEVALDAGGHGPVGLVHKTIADRMREYEKDTGKGTLARMPASFWRRTNVAFSIRHVPGVSQEVGARALINNVGPLSYLRGTRAEHFLTEYGLNHSDPSVRLGAQRLREMGRGTVAAFTEDLSRHMTPEQIAHSPLGRTAKWWADGEAKKLSGAPLRAVRGAMKGFNKLTDGILRVERAAIEHPPQVAGMGKHYNEEFKRIHGQRLKVIGAFNDVEKAFLRGQLDPKALDHFGNVAREYWGDWNRASPSFKKAMSVSPFLQWYLNSLRFVYHTMPVHHPMKTGMLAAMESATREQRLAEGQEYKGGVPLGEHLLPTDLEPSQQGSLPYGKGERAGQEYYTPQGAVSGGLESGLDSILPYLSGTWSVLHGINPLTDKPLEETIEGKKQPITDFNQLATLGALSAAESFIPPLRYYQSLQRKPPSYVFRPLRTEKTRTERGKPKAKGLPGGLSKGGLSGGLSGGLK